MHAFNNISSIIGSTAFVNRAKNQNVQNAIILSLDTESLFTNVPLLELTSYSCQYPTRNNMQIEIPLSTLEDFWDAFGMCSSSLTEPTTDKEMESRWVQS